MDTDAQHEGAQTQHEGAQTQHEGAQTQHEGAQTQHEGAQTQHEGAQTQQETTTTSVVQEKKNRRRRHLRQTKKRGGDSSSGDEDGQQGEGGKGSQQVKRTKTHVREGAQGMTFTNKAKGETKLFAFESSGMEMKRQDDVATRTSDMGGTYQHGVATATETATNDDHADDDSKSAVYKGMSSYKDYRAGFRQIEGDPAKKKAMHGPLKPSTHVRMSVLVDYQPDVCKDYKETGYCGFGDSCKFLHDRGDYKAGWQLDRDWEEEQKARKAREREGWIDADDDDSSDDDDGLPFACFICRRPWEECHDPVVTQCGHHFCEQCALKHNAKSSKCFVCGKPTGGIFNVAKDILKKQERRNVA